MVISAVRSLAICEKLVKPFRKFAQALSLLQMAVDVVQAGVATPGGGPLPTEKLPGGKTFLEHYNKQGYGNPPEAYGPFAYAAAELLMDAIEKVGPDRKKIIAELAHVNDRDSIVGKITFDDHGQNTVPAITRYVVQDGKWLTWEESEYASGKRKLVGK